MKDKNKSKEQFINELKELEAKHKRTGELLRKNEERYSTFLETIPHGIQEIDTSGIITFTNKAYDKIFGFEKGKAIGTSILDKLTHDSERKKLADYLKTLVEDQPPPTPYFETNITKEGKIIDVQVDWNYKRDKKGRVVGFVSVITDITRRNRAEKELSESEEQYRLLAETAIEGIYQLDSSRNYVFMNEAYAKILGYKREELLGKNAISVVPELEREKATKMPKDIGPENPSRGEFTLKHKLGHGIPVYYSMVPQIKQEQITGYTGTIIDITKRKRAEEEIKKTKDHLDNIIESSIDSIVVTDSKGIITRVNKAFLKLIGYKEEEIIGKYYYNLRPSDVGTYELITGDLLEINEDFLNDAKTVSPKLFEEGKIENRESYLLHKNGKVLLVENNIVLLYNKKGDVIGGVAIIRDIAQRKKAEKEIKEGKEFLESIIEGSRDGIAIVDDKGYIISVNTALEKMCKLRKEKLIGKHISTLTIEDKNLREKIRKKVGELFEKGFTFYEAKHGVGEEDFIDVECNISMIKDIKGNYIAGVSIIRDITERKRAEEKVIEYQSRLKSLTSQMTLTEEKERKRFAEYLHDQIGQPLCSLRFKLETLGKRVSFNDPDEDLDKSFKIIDQIIKDTRSLTFDLSPPILYQLGLEAALEWLTEQTSEQYGIMVAFENNEQEKALKDDLKIFLFQAVRELLTNVAKHARAQNAKVSIQGDDSHIRVCVEDDGVGLTSLERNFSSNSKGGFGLFSIEERLDHLGGHFEIESKPGCGTRAIMVAPLKDEK